MIKSRTTKNLTLALALAFPFAASAEFLITGDFKDGTYNPSAYWIDEGVIINSKMPGVNGETIHIVGSTISGNTLTSTTLHQTTYGSLVSNMGNIIMDNATFSGNAVTLGVQDQYSLYGGIVATKEYGSEADDGNKLTVNNSAFTSNNIALTGALGTLYGGVNSILNGNTATFTGTNFTSNIMTSEGRIQGGVLQAFTNPSLGYQTAVLTVADSQFTGNTSTAVGMARGGAVENYDSSFIVSNTLFENNGVHSTGSDALDSCSYGGAFYFSNSASVSTLTDITLTGNWAQNGYGGAVVLKSGAKADFVATKDAVFAGNYATDMAGTKDDSRGGFLYMFGTTSNANFNVAAGATLTIGDGTAGYDSIASRTADAVITKAAAGALVVNGSMHDYLGTLNVSEGEMQVLNQLGTGQLNLYRGASLVLLSGGFSRNGNMYLEADSALTFILGADFDESSDLSFYLAEATVTLSGFDDINDIVTIKNNDGSAYTGNWFVSLDESGILFNPVPEPSAYAAILGALALVFTYRRKSNISRR